MNCVTGDEAWRSDDDRIGVDSRGVYRRMTLQRDKMATMCSFSAKEYGFESFFSAFYNGYSRQGSMEDEVVLRSGVVLWRAE